MQHYNIYSTALYRGHTDGGRIKQICEKNLKKKEKKKKQKQLDQIQTKLDIDAWGYAYP